MLNEGRITERGTYKELIHDDGDFAEFCATYLSEQKEEEDETHDGRSPKVVRGQGDKEVGDYLSSSPIATLKQTSRHFGDFF